MPPEGHSELSDDCLPEDQCEDEVQQAQVMEPSEEAGQEHEEE